MTNPPIITTNPEVSFLSKFFSKPKQLQIVRKSSHALSLHEWRSEKALVASAGKVWADPDFQMMIQVLQNEHPAYAVFPPDARADMRMAHQAKCEGYTMALSNLKAMRVFEKAVELEQPTFEPEEPDKL